MPNTQRGGQQAKTAAKITSSGKAKTSFKDASSKAEGKKTKKQAAQESKQEETAYEALLCKVEEKRKKTKSSEGRSAKCRKK